MYDDKALQSQRMKAVRALFGTLDSLRRRLLAQGFISPTESAALQRVRDSGWYQYWLRSILIREMGRLDTLPLWKAIDACSFLADAEPGRWPYTEASDWSRLLDWSLQASHEVRHLLAPARLQPSCS